MFPPMKLLLVENDSALHKTLLHALTQLCWPFSAGETRSGSGLGLAICHEIVLALEGSISLDNHERHGDITGLDSTARLPLAQNAA